MRGTGDGAAADGAYPAQGALVSRSPQPAAGRLPPADETVAGAPSSVAALVGYRGPTACAAAGITYRQLDYWARTGLVEPSVCTAQGSGTQRLYSVRDVAVLKIVKRLLDTGVSLQNIRTAVGHLRTRDLADLARMTLMCDGATVYECASPDEVVDLLKGGQGVFGIAVSVVWREVEAALAQLPGERVDTGETLVGHNPEDELARRRNRAV